MVKSPSRICCAIWSSALAIACAALSFFRAPGVPTSQLVVAHSLDASDSTPSPKVPAARQSYCCQSSTPQPASVSGLPVGSRAYSTATADSSIEAPSISGAKPPIAGSGSRKCSTGGSSCDSSASSEETSSSRNTAMGGSRSRSVRLISATFATGAFRTSGALVATGAFAAGGANDVVDAASGNSRAKPGTNGRPRRNSDLAVTGRDAFGVRCGTNGRCGFCGTTSPPSCTCPREARIAPERFQSARAPLRDA